MLLSIVIPTYNRASLLKRTLDSLSNQMEGISPSEVEIVVSDNASCDETECVCSEFKKKCLLPFRFFRQIEFLPPSLHFIVAMEQAHGEFIKLCNDTLIVRPNAISWMVQEIRMTQAIKSLPLLWFANGVKGVEPGGCRSVTEMIRKMSYFSTWIMPFGVWRKDLSSVRTIFATDVTRLPQTIFLLSEMKKGRRVHIIGTRWCSVQEVPKKGGYNVAEIFGRNYFLILGQYVRNGDISYGNLAREKYRMLRHINYQYFDWRRRFGFQRTGYFKYMLPIYWRCLYFYLALIYRSSLWSIGWLMFTVPRTLKTLGECSR